MKIIKNKIVLSLLVGALLAPTITNAKDGKDLFKQNCSACHKIDAKLIGPALKDVRAKWADAGEAENLIKWVQNPAELFNSNTSDMAKAAWDFSPTEMTAQSHLSAEDIASIFDYVDAPPVAEETNTGGDNTGDVLLSDERIYTPEEAAEIRHRKESFNRTVFFILLLIAACLVGGIVSISKTTQTFLTLMIRRGDGPKEEKKSNKTGSIISVLLVLFTLMPFTGSAMAIDFEREGWIIVSDLDNIFMFIGNLLLLWVLFDQRKTMRGVIAQYDESLLHKTPEGEEETLAHILTGAVPVEDEASIMLDHDYDGIHELDNNLPPWWVWGFVATIVFAVVYLVHFHVIGTGDLQIVEYNKSVEAAQIEVDKYMSKMAMNVDESNVTLLTEAADLAKGKDLFITNCVVCHKEKGEGLIGPNLTDKHWLTGDGSINSVFEVIKYGTSNGMPEHESKMNPVELQQVSSYVLQLEFTEGKEPEGKEIK